MEARDRCWCPPPPIALFVVRVSLNLELLLDGSQAPSFFLIAFRGHTCLFFIANIMSVGMVCSTHGGFLWADLILSSSGALEPFLRAGTADHRDACRVRKWRQCQPQRDEVGGVAKRGDHTQPILHLEPH